MSKSFLIVVIGLFVVVGFDGVVGVVDGRRVHLSRRHLPHSSRVASAQSRGVPNMTSLVTSTNLILPFDGDAFNQVLLYKKN